MISIEIPKKIKEVFTNNEIKNILESILNIKNIEFVVNETDRTFGRYFIINKKDEKIYVLLSAKEEEGRNSFLTQYFSTGYIDYLNDTSEHKRFVVYICVNNIFVKDAGGYHDFILRSIVTIEDIQIFPKSEKILPFNSYEEFKFMRSKNRNKHSSNASSYITEEDESFVIYGKSFGANKYESELLFFTIDALNNKYYNKNIKFFSIPDNNEIGITEKFKQILDYKNVYYSKLDIEVYKQKENVSTDKKDFRNTTLFHYNLLKKYGEKKCLVCECDIDRVIVGAHIHRVSDINKSNIAEDNKMIETTDADNGMWLCTLHDKLFEVGLIYFNKKELMCNNSLQENQKDFIKKRTNIFYIPEEFYNENMIFYLNKHLERIKY